MKTLMLSAALALLCAGPTHAGERITPTCWEENVNGEVQRHCEVNRPSSPAKPRLAPVVRAPAPMPMETYQSVPQEVYQLPPPLPPPPNFGPGFRGSPYRYGPFPTGYSGPGYYGPVYGGLPPIFFRFGPLGVVINPY